MNSQYVRAAFALLALAFAHCGPTTNGSTAPQASAPPPETPSLNMKPYPISSFDTATFVTAINDLRHAGKDKALRELANFIAEYKESGGVDEDVQIICRALFARPGGWYPPVLGAEFPDCSLHTTERLSFANREFPQFPLVIYNGTPFVLIQGYSGGGLFTRPEIILKECQNYDLIQNDLPPFDPEKASRDAEALISSGRFKELFLEKGRLDMAEGIVRNQVRKGGRSGLSTAP